ncbi:hypothetical protein DPMN_115533 [Dreissena polymorpha]|uniref:Uncharacterized protein n=1 Tax=Dreissena polymorpha TaxID=45954 RepID=A0A9D4KLD1_DREPO|nr:hypothetical protein DPMN_115533 [Dreissena polymorpha]
MSPGHRNCDAAVTAVWLVLTRQQCKGNRHAAKARDQQQRRLVSLKYGRYGPETKKFTSKTNELINCVVERHFAYNELCFLIDLKKTQVDLNGKPCP